VSILIGTYGRINEGILTVQILDGDKTLAVKEIQTNTLTADGYVELVLDKPVTDIRNKELLLRISASNAGTGNGVAIGYYRSEAKIGRFQVNVINNGTYFVDGQAQEGSIAFSLQGKEQLLFGRLYWPFVAIAEMVLCIICAQTVGLKRRGKTNVILLTMQIYRKYEFLIRQLISRDFKTKYKRSLLGIFWSFLNPLLTMAVQYIVFSTIFKSNTPYYAVYLLSGILMFGFFTEAVGQGIMSIVSNATLITKVYLPKYIYPISRVLSSTVNLGISLIPLLLTMLIMGLPLTKALFLVPFGILFLIIFSMGISLLLSTAMVFFRDTQFLWGIISMLWTYLTPIFYPENILPPQLWAILRFNPMYQYIAFMRTIIISGRSPDPVTYIWCSISSLSVLLLGLWVFKKKQDRFVFYL
jgi:ABC-2 type transport system permease protein